jgi:hypothetical protein
MANAATLSLNVPAITALCKGNRGSIIYVSAGPPSNFLGLSADFYVDANTGLYYGPKINDSLWPSTPVFTLNNPVSSYPLILVPGATTIAIPAYNINTNTIYLSSNYSGILGGINNALTGDNSFILGSNITASITGFTLVNNLSSTSSVFTSAGNSDQWNSDYVNSLANSARWTSSYLNLTSNSAAWTSSYSNLTANSAIWRSTYSTMSANSGNWQTTYNIVNAFSYLTYTYNAPVSSIIPAHGTNTATGSASNVGGGNFNNATGCYSSVLGGVCNTASGYYSNITGGFGNSAINVYANVAGGVRNTASGYGSSIGGGTGNNASGYNAAIAAGFTNTASNSSAFIGGGKFNTASGIRSVVVGGLNNTASGNYSFVAGGSANDTKGFANTFILGSNLSAIQANTTYINNLSVQGTLNVNGSINAGTASTSTFNSLNVINGVTVGGTLSGAGSSTFNSLNITNNTTVSGTLQVAGASTLNSLGVTNNATVGGTLGVTNNATVGGTLGVTNNATVGGTLGVTSNATVGGNVGIGTSSPNVPLSFGTSVNGAPGQPNILRLFDTGSSTTSYGFGISPGTLNVFSPYSALFTVGNQVSALYINSNGNVGIGTITPNQALTVNGNVSATGNITATGNINSSGTTSAGAPTKTVTDADYTVLDGDCGGTIYMNSTAAHNVTIASATVRNGFQVTIIRTNTGDVTFTGGTINQAYSLTKLSARYSAATLTWNSTFGWVLFGDLA